MAKEGAATFKKRVVKKDTKSKKSELKLEALPDSKPESAAVGKSTPHYALHVHELCA